MTTLQNCFPAHNSVTSFNPSTLMSLKGKSIIYIPNSISSIVLSFNGFKTNFLADVNQIDSKCYPLIDDISVCKENTVSTGHTHLVHTKFLSWSELTL